MGLILSICLVDGMLSGVISTMTMMRLALLTRTPDGTTVSSAMSEDRDRRSS